MVANVHNRRARELSVIPVAGMNMMGAGCLLDWFWESTCPKSRLTFVYEIQEKCPDLSTKSNRMQKDKENGKSNSCEFFHFSKNYFLFHFEFYSIWILFHFNSFPFEFILVRTGSGFGLNVDVFGISLNSRWISFHLGFNSYEISFWNNSAWDVLWF